MRLDYPKSLGISLVGWSVSISNILLFVSYYYVLLTQQTQAPMRWVSFLSMAAVFPEDFFHAYLSEFWLVHFCWMFMILICAFGILLLNAFARLVFIVLNIIHAAILFYIFILHSHEPGSLDYFFRFYFSCAFVFAYVGFITIPEVREQFRSRREGAKGGQRRSARNLLSQDAQGYYHLALAYSRLHRSADAIAALQKAIRVNPEDERYQFELGTQFLKERNSSEALAAFKAVVRIDPKHFGATYHLGQLYQSEGCGPEAVFFLEQAGQLQPNNSQVFFSLGKACLLNDDYVGAVKAFQRSLQINPRDAMTSYQLGWVLLNKQANAEGAREMLRTAVHLRPDMVDGHFQLGMACLKLNRDKEAVRAFKDTLFKDATHTQAYYQLGLAYVALNDLDSARRQSQALRDLDPDLAQQLSMLIAAQ